jgi:hypothetical protein
MSSNTLTKVSSTSPLPQWRQALSDLKSALYRKPKKEFLRAMRWGPVAYFRCNAWAREMEQAAKELPPIPAHNQSHDLWFLTGSRFWYQTAFCAWSFAKQAHCSLHLHLVDDGTLQEGQIEALTRIFEKVSVVRASDIRARIEEALPENKFPVLRQRWHDYVHIRKLTDIHLGNSGPKLVLDSDMLFFKRPAVLLDWLAERSTQQKLLHMVDCEESYGYSRELMEKLAGGALPKRLNVGICGLRSEWLDWEEIEYWCRTLLEKEGTNYYLEQALVAMLAVRHITVEAPSPEYITFPTNSQIRQNDGVLQHYVADSKPGYFQAGWQNAMQLVS